MSLGQTSPPKFVHTTNQVGNYKLFNFDLEFNMAHQVETKLTKLR